MPNFDDHLAHIAGLEKKFGPVSEEVAVALNTLARLICRNNEAEGAIPYFERCIAIRESLGGPAAVLPHLDAWIDQDNPVHFNVREPFILKRLEIKASLFGENDSRVARECDGLASTYSLLKRFRAARIFLERSLAIKEAIDGPRSAEVADTLEHLVDACLREGRLAQADQYLERCIGLSEPILGKTSDEMAKRLVTLAAALIASTKHERKRYHSEGVRKARPLFERALAIHQERFGPDSLQVQRTLETISQACLECGEFVSAQPLLERLLAICERVYGNDAAALLWILVELARGYADAGWTSAEPMLERSYDVLRSFLDARKPIIRSQIVNLAGNNEVLYRVRGDLLEKLVRASERHRSNTRRRWGASR